MPTTVVLRCGYVEEGDNAVLILVNANEFRAIDPLEHVAEIFKSCLQGLLADNGGKLCCSRYVETTRQRHCPECGEKLANIALNCNFIEMFVRKVVHGTADTSGDIWQLLNDNGWSMHRMPQGHVIEVVHKAEKVICQLIKPEDWEQYGTSVSMRDAIVHHDVTLKTRRPGD